MAISLNRFVPLAALTVAHAAWGQSSVTLYGVIDLAAKIETNADGNGHAAKSLGPGATGGSRVGFTGTEDLGGGLKASFRLESGFNADTGTMSDASRFFNRESWVGLSGSFGEVRLGHQFTVLWETFNQFDAMFGISNVNESIPYLAYSAGIDPVHVDNAVRYAKASGPASVDLIVAPGEVAGSNTKGLYTGASVKYVDGAKGLAAFYEQSDANTAATEGLAKKRTWGVGGSYPIGPATLYATYLNHNAMFALPTEIRGNLYSLGVVYPLGAVTLFGAAYYDTQRNDSGLSANRSTAAVSAYYNFSKRTAAYVYLDATHWKDGYVELLADSYGNRTRRSNLMVGMRHDF